MRALFLLLLVANLGLYAWGSQYLEPNRPAPAVAGDAPIGQLRLLAEIPPDQRPQPKMVEVTPPPAEEPAPPAAETPEKPHSAKPEAGKGETAKAEKAKPEKPKAEPKPAESPAEKADLKATAKAGSKPEAKPEAKPEPKEQKEIAKETKEESKPAEKVAPKKEEKQASKEEAPAESKQEAKHETRPEPKNKGESTEPPADTLAGTGAEEKTLVAAEATGDKSPVAPNAQKAPEAAAPPAQAAKTPKEEPKPAFDSAPPPPAFATHLPDFEVPLPPELLEQPQPLPPAAGPGSGSAKGTESAPQPAERPVADKKAKPEEPAATPSMAKAPEPPKPPEPAKATEPAKPAETAKVPEPAKPKAPPTELAAARPATANGATGGSVGADGSRCGLMGPVPERGVVSRLLGQLMKLGVAPSITTRPGEKMSFWVMMPPLADRAAAEQMLARLAEAGFKEQWRVNQGNLVNAISLGTFSKRTNAERHAADLKAHGFPVELRESGGESGFVVEFPLTGSLNPDTPAWQTLQQDNPGIQLTTRACTLKPGE